MNHPTSVSIIEVGPRDGLQNEPKAITTEVKLKLIELLADSGLTTIETTSFVSPKWVPQMADHKELIRALHCRQDITYPALVPNMQGYRDAVAAGCQTIAVFTAASDQFSLKNINCTVEESLSRIKEICHHAEQDGIKVRGYVSCVLGCPYEGNISKERVLPVAHALCDLGCYEVSLGDTIGVGTPLKTKALIEHVLTKLPETQVAMHFHDTYGQALANIYASLLCGIHKFDASVAGLGGCPYAPGASGNVATEDVLYLLEGMDITTGVDLSKLMVAGKFITQKLGRKTRSRVSLALSHHP